MEFNDVVVNRSSTRKFTGEAVDKGMLKEICQLGNMAPSVNNFKTWRFVALTNKPLMSRIANIIADKIDALPDTTHEAHFQIKKQAEYFATFFENAPAVIFVFNSPSESIYELGMGVSHDEINRIQNYPEMQSVGACVENMLLAAVNLGLGACWLSSSLIAKQEIAEILNVEQGYELAAMVAVGHRVNPPSPKSNTEIDTIFDFVS